MRANQRFFGWFAPHHIDDEVGIQAAQVEAAIEAIGEGGQVSSCQKLLSPNNQLISF